ncbi:MAG: hypothetical protein ABW046_23425 [Actinoplanes sp.]
MSTVDALIITALPEEYRAALAVTGASEWRKHGTAGPAPYVTTEYRAGNGRTLSVALARPTRMGGRSTGPIATMLTDELRPTCLAMCGVCAGRPGSTRRGDVIVAESACEWDEGRHTGADFHPDRQQYPQDDRWLRAAQDFDPAGLPGHGVHDVAADEVGGPERLPFRVFAGPMASGSAVISVPGFWTRLSAGQRRIMALEMEAATIATVAHERRVPHWLVAKGVMDHADLAKDDRFKSFAARASAEVLFALLGRLLIIPVNG